MDGSVPCREGRLQVAPQLSLYYRDYGADTTATPVVCLHGYWRTARDFEELARHLAPSRRVVTPDLRGRGRSDRSSDGRDYDFERLVEDVERLMQALGLGRAVFVGLALGAQLIMELAVRRAEYVAGVVFNDSGPESNSAAGHRMKAFSGDDELTREAALARVKAQYEAAFPRMTEADFERLLHRNYARNERGGYVRDFDQLTNQGLARTKAERPNFWDEFRRIPAVPIAVLRGANSDFLTPEIVARMVREHPSTTVHVIPDCGHPVMLWEPEAFAAIDALLAEVDAREGAVRAPA